MQMNPADSHQISLVELFRTNSPHIPQASAPPKKKRKIISKCEVEENPSCSDEESAKETNQASVCEGERNLTDLVGTSADKSSYLLDSSNWRSLLADIIETKRQSMLCVRVF